MDQNSEIFSFFWVKIQKFSPFYGVKFNFSSFLLSQKSKFPLLIGSKFKISPFYWVKNSPLLFGFQPAVANVNLEMVTLNFYLFEVFWRANGKCIDTPASSTGNFDPRKIVSTPSVSYINTAVHYEDPFVRSDVDMHREQNWIIRNSFLVLIRTETSTA